MTFRNNTIRGNSFQSHSSFQSHISNNSFFSESNLQEERSINDFTFLNSSANSLQISDNEEKNELTFPSEYHANGYLLAMPYLCTVLTTSESVLKSFGTKPLEREAMVMASLKGKAARSRLAHIINGKLKIYNYNPDAAIKKKEASFNFQRIYDVKYNLYKSCTLTLVFRGKFKKKKGIRNLLRNKSVANTLTRRSKRQQTNKKKRNQTIQEETVDKRGKSSFSLQNNNIRSKTIREKLTEDSEISKKSKMKRSKTKTGGSFSISPFRTPRGKTKREAKTKDKLELFQLKKSNKDKSKEMIAAQSGW